MYIARCCPHSRNLDALSQFTPNNSNYHFMSDSYHSDRLLTDQYSHLGNWLAYDTTYARKTTQLWNGMNCSAPCPEPINSTPTWDTFIL